MATMREVIRVAWERHSGRYGDVPDGPVEEAWLRIAQSMYDGWFEAGLFGRLQPKLIDSDYDAEEGQYLSATEDVTAILPATVEDEDARSPRDLTPIGVTLGEPEQKFIYERGVGDWVAISSLALTDYAPLSGKGLDGLACCIAVEAGSDRPEVVRSALRFKNSLSMNASNPSDDVQALYY